MLTKDQRALQETAYGDFNDGTAQVTKLIVARERIGRMAIQY